MAVVMAVTVFTFTAMAYFKRDGLHRLERWTLNDNPMRFDPYWIAISRFVNTVALWVCTLTAGYTMWVNETAMDVVLNSCGVFFIEQIDEQFVSEQCYRDFEQFLKVRGVEPADYQISTPAKVFTAVLNVLGYMITVFCILGYISFVLLIFFCPI